MLKGVISGGLILLSLALINLGWMSFLDAEILFRKFEFNNIFNESKWVRFKQIFVVYAIFIFLLAVLNWVKYKSVIKYFTSERNLIKNFTRDLFTEIKRKKWLYIITLLILIFGISIRAFQLNRPIRYDESFTYLEYGRSYIGYILMNYSYPNNHILHSVFVRLSTMNFGGELWAIRIPAFAGGVLVLIFSFLLGRKWFGLKAGILALILVVCSEWLIQYSVNARGYSLQTALFLFVLFLTLGKQKSTGRWLLISSLNAIGFWIIPSYIFCLTVLFIIKVLLDRFQVNLVLFFALSILLSILLYLPVFAYTGSDSLFNNPVTQTYNNLNYLQEFFTNMHSIYVHLTPGEGFVQFCIFLLFIGTSFLKKTKGLSIGILITLILMMAILGNNIPSRILIFLIPIAALLLSGSLSNNLKLLKPQLFFALLLLPFISWSIFKNKRFDYEIALDDLPQLVGDLKSKNTVGLISKSPFSYPVRYYLSKNNQLKASWNSFGTDTVYVITSELYHQNPETLFEEKSKDYHFSPLKNYKHCTVHLGVKQR